MWVSDFLLNRLLILYRYNEIDNLTKGGVNRFRFITLDTKCNIPEANK